MSSSIKQRPYEILTVAVGGTVTLPNGLVTSGNPNVDNIIEYLINGTDTLTSNLIYTMTTPATGTHINIFWKAILTPAGSTLTILGKSIPSRLMAKTFILKGVYNGASWDTYLFADNDETINIDGSSVVDGTITDAKVTALAAAKLTGTVSDTQIAGMNANKLSGSIDPARYANNTIPAASIVVGSLTSTQLADGAVTTSKLASTGILHVNSTGGSTTAVVTAEILGTYSLPLNTLTSNGQALLIKGAFTFLNNANTKTASIEVNGQTIYSNATAVPTDTAPNDGRLYVEFLLVRTSSTTATIMGMSHMTVSTTTSSAPGIGAVTGLDFTAAQDIDWIGQNGTANAGDIVFVMGTVEKVL